MKSVTELTDDELHGLIAEDQDLRHYPNYPRDLSAMREAVKSLNSPEYSLFQDYLYTLTRESWKASGDTHARFVTEATARQRAEAYAVARNLARA